MKNDTKTTRTRNTDIGLRTIAVVQMKERIARQKARKNNAQEKKK